MGVFAGQNAVLAAGGDEFVWASFKAAVQYRFASD
jgi:hypothetical protein